MDISSVGNVSGIVARRGTWKRFQSLTLRDILNLEDLASI